MTAGPGDLVLEPVRDDAGFEAGAALLLDAFAGEFNARLGRGYARAWMRAFAWDGAWLAIARRSREPVGFVAGLEETGLAARYRPLRRTAAAALLRRPWLMIDPAFVRLAWQRLRRASLPHSPSDCWYLPLIGVAGFARGRGAGRALLAAHEAEGRRRGAPRAALSVREENASAIRLYERSGWCLTRRGDGRRRYEKALGA
jgi:ribosomal protein S18 acetylase RimI-like enzyme